MVKARRTIPDAVRATQARASDPAASAVLARKGVFVPFKDGKPDGYPRDVLSGFVNGQDQAQGRPVGVAFDKAGALLVADDVGNTIWRVTPGTTAASR